MLENKYQKTNKQTKNPSVNGGIRELWKKQLRERRTVERWPHILGGTFLLKLFPSPLKYLTTEKRQRAAAKQQEGNRTFSCLKLETNIGIESSLNSQDMRG